MKKKKKKIKVISYKVLKNLKGGTKTKNEYIVIEDDLMM